MRLLFVLIGLVVAGTSLAQAPARPAKLGLCVGCHGVDGRASVAGTPHLAAQDRSYLQRTLLDFRSGARRSNPMTAIAGSLQTRDIEQLAAWYAAQPAMKPSATKPLGVNPR